MKKINELLQDELIRQLGDHNGEECAILLSGGVDSMSVAFAALNLGIPIHAYTFYMEGRPPEERYDALKAEEVAIKNNFPCTIVEVPRNNIEEDFLFLIDPNNGIDCNKKTQVECCFPFVHILPKISQKIVLSGWAADGYYGISKKAILHYTNQGKAKFDEFRTEYFSDNARAGYKWLKRLCELHNKKIVAPYLGDEVREFFFAKDWDELNKPYQKYHVVESYNQFKNIKFKKHMNLQLSSGVDHAFEDELLNNNMINFKRRKRMLDVYRDWQRRKKEGYFNQNTLMRFM